MINLTYFVKFVNFLKKVLTKINIYVKIYIHQGYYIIGGVEMMNEIEIVNFFKKYVLENDDISKFTIDAQKNNIKFINNEKKANEILYRIAAKYLLDKAERTVINCESRNQTAPSPVL
jgi:cell division ATPase FtsA